MRAVSHRSQLQNRSNQSLIVFQTGGRSVQQCYQFGLLLVNSVGTPREQKIDTNLLREWEGLLQPHLPAPQRCRTLKELCESDRINRLEDVCKSR